MLSTNKTYFSAWCSTVRNTGDINDTVMNEFLYILCQNYAVCNVIVTKELHRTCHVETICTRNMSGIWSMLGDYCWNGKTTPKVQWTSHSILLCFVTKLHYFKRLWDEKYVSLVWEDQTNGCSDVVISWTLERGQFWITLQYIQWKLSHNCIFAKSYLNERLHSSEERCLCSSSRKLIFLVYDRELSSNVVCAEITSITAFCMFANLDCSLHQFVHLSPKK